MGIKQQSPSQEKWDDASEEVAHVAYQCWLALLCTVSHLHWLNRSLSSAYWRDGSQTKPYSPEHRFGHWGWGNGGGHLNMVSSHQGFLEGSWFGGRHPFFQSSFSSVCKWRCRIYWKCGHVDNLCRYVCLGFLDGERKMRERKWKRERWSIQKCSWSPKFHFTSNVFHNSSPANSTKSKCHLIHRLSDIWNLETCPLSSAWWCHQTRTMEIPHTPPPPPK